MIEIINQTAAWEDALDAARASMREGWKPAPHGDALLIFLPSTAMSLETAQQLGLRAGLRMVFGEILATCRAEGIPIVRRMRSEFQRRRGGPAAWATGVRLRRWVLKHREF